MSEDDVDSEGQEGTDEAQAERKHSSSDERNRSEEYLTRLKYLQADFENYRKRMDKEMREVEEYSARSIVTKLLSVLDELELASKHADEEVVNPELKEGISMVHKKLVSALESVGLSRIDAVGKPFDPSLHEAVEKVEGPSGEDIVVEEIRPGFMFRGQVIRPSMVKVELGRKSPEEVKENERG